MNGPFGDWSQPSADVPDMNSLAPVEKPWIDGFKKTFFPPGNYYDPGRFAIHGDTWQPRGVVRTKDSFDMSRLASGVKQEPPSWSWKSFREGLLNPVSAVTALNWEIRKARLEKEWNRKGTPVQARRRQIVDEYSVTIGINAAGEALTLAVPGAVVKSGLLRAAQVIGSTGIGRAATSWLTRHPAAANSVDDFVDVAGELVGAANRSQTLMWPFKDYSPDMNRQIAWAESTVPAATSPRVQAGLRGSRGHANSGLSYKAYLKSVATKQRAKPRPGHPYLPASYRGSGRTPSPWRSRVRTPTPNRIRHVQKPRYPFHPFLPPSFLRVATRTTKTYKPTRLGAQKRNKLPGAGR